MIATHTPRLLAALLLAGLAGCATTAPQSVASGSANARQARANLEALKADPDIVALAPEALADAEAALRTAETFATSDAGLRDHLGYLAEVKVETARSLAAARRSENLGKDLLVERERMRAEAAAAELERARLLAEEQRRALEALHAKRTEFGYVLTIRDVRFDSNQAVVKPESEKKLDPLLAFLLKYPDMTITVGGHTDATASDAYNQALSERRAQAIREILVGKGIDAARIKAVGHGESKPIDTNATPAGRQRNRRAEILFDQTP